LNAAKIPTQSRFSLTRGSLGSPRSSAPDLGPASENQLMKKQSAQKSVQVTEISHFLCGKTINAAISMKKQKVSFASTSLSINM
jgi:hypothetical protein